MNTINATADPIDAFLASRAFAVAGASSRRHKYGNKVLRAYQQNGLVAIPVNPREQSIEGVQCVASVLDLPPEVSSISVITPPAITERIVDQAIRKGIANVWMQPGAESDAAVAACRQAGINVIADGSCVLVVLRYRER
jgi:predicted CoA-binding protein